MLKKRDDVFSNSEYSDSPKKRLKVGKSTTQQEKTRNIHIQSFFTAYIEPKLKKLYEDAKKSNKESLFFDTSYFMPIFKCRDYHTYIEEIISDKCPDLKKELCKIQSFLMSRSTEKTKNISPYNILFTEELSMNILKTIFPLEKEKSIIKITQKDLTTKLFESILKLDNNREFLKEIADERIEKHPLFPKENIAKNSNSSKKSLLWQDKCKLGVKSLNSSFLSL